MNNLEQYENVYSDDIGMRFGLEICSKFTFKKYSHVMSKNFTLDVNTESREVQNNKNFKYLEINESNGIHHKEKMRK